MLLFMVAEILQNVSLHVLYSCYMKFYFYYKFNIYVIYFNIHFRHLYVYYMFLIFVLFVTYFYFHIIWFCVATFLFSLYMQICYSLNFLLQKKYLYFNNLNFLLYENFYFIVFALYSAGKIWLSVCMQDNVKPVFHYQIRLTDCSLLYYHVNLLKAIT